MPEERHSLHGGHTVVTKVQSSGKGATKRQTAFLVLIYGDQLGQRIALGRRLIDIGRAPENHVQVDQDSVSRRHCRIEYSSGRYRILDLRSTNGTYVNENPIEAHILKDGDQVKVGQTLFKFLMSDNVESQYHEEIYRLMTVDALTGTYNKRHFEEVLEKEVARCNRYNRSLSLILFDIDHFKKINDTHGHLAGDAILSKLGAVVTAAVRSHDIAARIGGEEFAVILPEVDLEGATAVAEKLRALVESTEFEFEKKAIPVTVSLGVATWVKGRRAFAELVKEADERLYTAKGRGRNRFCAGHNGHGSDATLGS